MSDIQLVLVQKFEELARYYDALASLAKKTGGDTGARQDYYVLRDSYSQRLGFALLSQLPSSTNMEKFVGQFNEKALRIFQA